MEEIMIDIRKQTAYFKEYFKEKDLVSMEEIIGELDELIYEKIQREIEEMRQSDQDDEEDPFDKKMDYMLDNNLI